MISAGTLTKGSGANLGQAFADGIYLHQLNATIWAQGKQNTSHGCLNLNSDNATPVLGERANNTGFLIDGQSNQNELGGGPAAQFNQDTIAEFQVITTGYKAEFGHASGGVVNVIQKRGSNQDVPQMNPIDKYNLFQVDATFRF